jgi:hypothetical protein
MMFLGLGEIGLDKIARKILRFGCSATSASLANRNLSPRIVPWPGLHGNHQIAEIPHHVSPIQDTACIEIRSRWLRSRVSHEYMLFSSRATNQRTSESLILTAMLDVHSFVSGVNTPASGAGPRVCRSFQASLRML